MADKLKVVNDGGMFEMNDELMSVGGGKLSRTSSKHTTGSRLGSRRNSICISNNKHSVTSSERLDPNHHSHSTRQNHHHRRPSIFKLLGEIADDQKSQREKEEEEVAMELINEIDNTYDTLTSSNPINDQIVDLNTYSTTNISNNVSSSNKSKIIDPKPADFRTKMQRVMRFVFLFFICHHIYIECVNRGVA
jgi:hypothetical protein